MSDASPPSSDRPDAKPGPSGQRRRRGGRGGAGQGGRDRAGAAPGTEAARRPGAGDGGDGAAAGGRGTSAGGGRGRTGATSGGGPARSGGGPAKGGGGGGRGRGGSARGGGGSASGRGGSASGRGGRGGDRGGGRARSTAGSGGQAAATELPAPPATPVRPLQPSSPVADHRVHENRRRMALLCTAGGLLPGLVVGLVLGLAVDAVAGVVAGVVVLVAVAVVLRRTAVSLTLRVVGGRSAEERELPALANLVDGLSATFGVRAPHLWLVDDPVPNACSVGGVRGRAVLVVTTGLVGALDLIQLEGVVAHELAHVKSHDAGVSAVAVATAGALGRLTGSDRWLRLAVGDGREYAADRRGVLGVRYPPGLRDALEALEEGPDPSTGSVFVGRRWAATRWLWIDPMVGARGAPPDGLLDATVVRRDALGEW